MSGHLVLDDSNLLVNFGWYERSYKVSLPTRKSQGIPNNVTSGGCEMALHDLNKALELLPRFLDALVFQ
jgi:hypothetical protein